VNEVLTGLFIKIILMTGIGFALKRCGILTDALQKGLSSILLAAVLPASILASANAETGAGTCVKLAYCSAVCCAYFAAAFAAAALSARLLRLPREKYGIFVTMCMLPNSSFLGMPLTKALFGSEGMMYAVVFSLFWQVFAFTLGLMALTGSKKIDLRALARDPATVVSILSLALYVSPLRLPESIVTALDDVGSMCLPLSLMIIGAGLSGIKPLRLLSEKYAYAVSALRLLILPGAVLAAMVALKADSLLASVCVVLTAMPVGSLNAVFAEQYDAPKDFAVTTIVQSTVLMLATLPLFLYLCETLL